MLAYTDTIYCNGNGLLTVQGSSSDDSIEIFHDNGVLRINGNSVTCDDTSDPANASDVQGISVAGGNGNDDIDLSGINLSFFSNLSTGDVTIQGEAGHDTIIGSPVGDSIDGGSGDDILEGGRGDDTIIGGDGFDTYRFARTNDSEQLGHDHLVETTSETGTYYGSPIGDTLDFSDFEEAILMDLATDDTTGQEVTDFGSGNELRITLSDIDTFEGIIGTPYDDILFGNAGENVILGGDGTDLIQGFLGNDTLDGEDGDDEIYGNDGTGNYVSGDDDDVLIGGEGNDSLHGEQGNDVMYGGDGDDLMVGGRGNDELYGGADDDLIYGGVGDDILGCGDGTDTAFGGDGYDNLDSCENPTQDGPNEP